jgi:hypothetical protein
MVLTRRQIAAAEKAVNDQARNNLPAQVAPQQRPANAPSAANAFPTTNAPPPPPANAPAANTPPAKAPGAQKPAGSRESTNLGKGKQKQSAPESASKVPDAQVELADSNDEGFEGDAALPPKIGQKRLVKRPPAKKPAKQKNHTSHGRCCLLKETSK